MKKIIKKFSLFEWAMLLSVIGFTIYFALIDKESTKLYLIVDGIAASIILDTYLKMKGK